MCNAWNHPADCECGFGPPYHRDVSGFFDQHFGDTGGRDLTLAGRSTKSLGSTLDDSELATQLASTFLWQSFIGSSSFKWPLKPADEERPVVIYVVRHGKGWPRHDLLVFDPRLRQDEIVEGRIEASPRELRDGWSAFRRAYLENASLPQWLSGLRMADIPEIAIEALHAQPHFFIAMHPPKIVQTARVRQNSPSVASPALGVSTKVTGSSRSTVGVITSDARGRYGVTTALHSVERRGAFVFVRGRQGTIRARDKITDSCFIEMADPAFPRLRPCKGALTGVTPRGSELVWFDGITSGRKTTQISGWTPELPAWRPGVQSRVLTPPVTEPGDSGAALLNRQGHILGFAQYRTGVNERAPHAAWIWAASVFASLNLH